MVGQNEPSHQKINVIKKGELYSMNAIKLGVIGCGIAARDLHWPALQKLNDKFKITVVCNHTEKKAKIFSKLVGGVPYVTDYQDLLKRSDVEAVDIAIPFQLNCQVTEDSLKAGKHVIVEKPMAYNLAEGNRMVSLEKQYPSLVTMVAENFLYIQVFRHAKSYMDQGEIGEPYAVFFNHFENIKPDNKYIYESKWRLQRDIYPAGFCTDGGVHFVSVLRYLFGDIVNGGSYVRSVNPDVGGLDCWSFQFNTVNNIYGIHNQFSSAKGYSEKRMIVLGTKGSILIENFSKIILKRDERVEHEEVFEDDFGYPGEFEDFYQAIRTGRKVLSTFSDAYADLRVNMNSIKSAKIFSR